MNVVNEIVKLLIAFVQKKLYDKVLVFLTKVVNFKLFKQWRDRLLAFLSLFFTINHF